MLQTEPDPALYVYHQIFRYGGRELTRRGFMARVRLERFGEGKIYPHEETHAAAKADRLMLTRACKANLSQIFGLYPDEDNEAQEILEDAVGGQTPLEATDHLGVVHRLWPVTDVRVIARRGRRDGPPSRCSSPTATTATKPPATTATKSRPAGPLRPEPSRPTSC